jgi:hypothetical protein
MCTLKCPASNKKFCHAKKEKKYDPKTGKNAGN